MHNPSGRFFFGGGGGRVVVGQHHFCRATLAASVMTRMHVPFFIETFDFRKAI